MGEVIEFRPREAPDAEDETVFLHRVRGDSMEPTARDGDTWVSEAADSFTGPGIYAITDGDCYPVFKRLEPVPGSTGLVRIQSDNPAYPEQEVGLDDLIILQRVVGHIDQRGG